MKSLHQCTQNVSFFRRLWSLTLQACCMQSRKQLMHRPSSLGVPVSVLLVHKFQGEVRVAPVIRAAFTVLGDAVLASSAGKPQ